MNCSTILQFYVKKLYNYFLMKSGLSVTLSLVKFSFISALTFIAEKYSSRKILTKSFESSETKTSVKSLAPFFVRRKRLHASNRSSNSSAECSLVFSCSQWARASCLCSLQNFSFSGEEEMRCRNISQWSISTITCSPVSIMSM